MTGLTPKEQRDEAERIGEENEREAALLVEQLEARRAAAENSSEFVRVRNGDSNSSPSQNSLNSYISYMPDFNDWLGDGEAPEPEPPMDCVYQGFAGDYVRAVSHLTEAHPLAIQAQLLVAFGNMIGRGPHFPISEANHYTNENLMIVGPTSEGGKGQSQGIAYRVFENVDDDWLKHRVRSGLSSGEGIIYHIRDAVTKYRNPTKEEIQKGAHPDEGIPEIDDFGEMDKRLMVMESEFAMALQSMRRDGNTLSALMRAAWDGKPLNTLTRGGPGRSPLRCEEPHLSVTGHITPEELVRLVSNTPEIANGLLNRFVMLYVRKVRKLSIPPKLSQTDLREYSDRLVKLADRARGIRFEIAFDEDAKPLFDALYNFLDGNKYGSEVFQKLTVRAAAHIRRFAMLYALLDGRDSIGLPHLKAAAALWEYSLRSVEYIFSTTENTLGREKRGLLEYIHIQGGSITRTEVSRYFGGNRSSDQLSDMADEMVKAGYIDVAKKDRVELWTLSERHRNPDRTNSTNSTNSPPYVRIQAELKKYPDEAVRTPTKSTNSHEMTTVDTDTGTGIDIDLIPSRATGKDVDV